MIIEILKEIELSIGYDAVIAWLCFIGGIGVGGTITDILFDWSGEWKGDEYAKKLYKIKNDTHGCGVIKTAQNVADRKRGKVIRFSKTHRRTDRRGK